MGTWWCYLPRVSNEISRNTTKPTKWPMRPAKTQISLGNRSVWSKSDQSLLYAQWLAKDPTLLRADRVDSDQTGRMPRLVWVFARRAGNCVEFVVLQFTFYLQKKKNRSEMMCHRCFPFTAFHHQFKSYITVRRLFVCTSDNFSSGFHVFTIIEKGLISLQY